MRPVVDEGELESYGIKWDQIYLTFCLQGL